MTRQRNHVERVRQAGGRRLCALLTPAAAAALDALLARGAASATAAVNEALIAAEKGAHA